MSKPYAVEPKRMHLLNRASELIDGINKYTRSGLYTPAKNWSKELTKVLEQLEETVDA